MQRTRRDSRPHPIWIASAQASPGTPDSPTSQSLPRARIIRRRAVFDATRNKGKRVSNRYLALNILPRDAVKTGETGTVAFLTPKRVGAATKRTQLRRRMREIYRRHLAQPDEKAYLVWVARPRRQRIKLSGLSQFL
jgi:ribonuclease P protein component